MVDLQTISVAVAASSVVLYIINLFLVSQREERNKKIATSTNIMQILYKEETVKSIGELLNCTWTNFQDFLRKYDSTMNPDHFAKRMTIFNIYETLGYLLKQGLVDKELIYVVGGSGCIFTWAKYKPVIEEYRKIAYGGDMMKYFEYFASEMWRMKQSKDPTFVRDQTLGLDFDKVFATP